jgi:hypothetical protein
MTDDVWYRYVDSDQEWTRDPLELTFPVKRYTAKCVVLNWHGKDKFVLLDARKRFAYPTRELAMASYIARKEREIRMMAARHDLAVEYLAAAKGFRDRGFVQERYEPPTLSDLFASRAPDGLQLTPMSRR